MQRVFPKQKAALTRAKKVGYSKVLAVVVAAITEWNEIGAWPDDWRIFQSALIDSANKQTRETGVYFNVPRMESL
jgi:hypothetical protein